MKWRIEVAEKVFATNIYKVEAETQDEAKEKMLNGETEEMIATYEDESKILNVLSIQPITD
jgi:hypothetical protein